MAAPTTGRCTASATARLAEMAGGAHVVVVAGHFRKSAPRANPAWASPGPRVKVHLKLTDGLLNAIIAHLRQPHAVALERVGFVACAGGNTPDGIVLVGQSFHPVRDEDYEVDELVGARISSGAVRSAWRLLAPRETCGSGQCSCAR